MGVARASRKMRDIHAMPVDLISPNSGEVHAMPEPKIKTKAAQLGSIILCLKEFVHAPRKHPTLSGFKPSLFSNPGTQQTHVVFPSVPGRPLDFVWSIHTYPAYTRK